MSKPDEHDSDGNSDTGQPPIGSETNGGQPSVVEDLAAAQPKRRWWRRRTAADRPRREIDDEAEVAVESSADPWAEEPLDTGSDEAVAEPEPVAETEDPEEGLQSDIEDWLAFADESEATSAKIGWRARRRARKAGRRESAELPEPQDRTGEAPPAEISRPFEEAQRTEQPLEEDNEELTAEEYITSTTQEHAGLAAAVAAAASEESTEAQGVAAAMPGLESGVLGFEDVAPQDLALDEERALEGERRDLVLRVITGLLLAGLFVGALWWGTLAIGLLAVVVLLLALSEFYAVLLRSSYQPLALFGLLGALLGLTATWSWGPVGVPAALIVTTMVLLFYYALEPGRRNPLVNGALTLTGLTWVAGSGAFLLAMLDSPDFRMLIFATVALTVFMDTASYFAGRSWGKRSLSPRLSPNKTIAGLVGGVVIVMLSGAALGIREPFDTASGLVLGAVVAVGAPLGDLAVSLFKRSLGIKDTGVILPGHGGVLDRVDALLFVIPATWVAYRILGYVS